MGRKKIAVFANGWADEYVNMMLDGIRKKSDEEGADIFLFLSYASSSYSLTEDVDRGEYNIYELADFSRFDGAVILYNVIHPLEIRNTLCDRIVKSGIPAVAVLADPNQVHGIDCLGTDNYAGIRELAEHLITVHGSRNIIYLGGPENNFESLLRLNAIRDALESHGLTLPGKNVYFGDWSYYHALEITERICREHPDMPDAIMCGNDTTALAVCNVLSSHGYSVPQDIKVTGFDHIPSTQNYYPSISSVERDWSNMGYQALTRVLDRIRHRPISSSLMYPTHMALEESCGCPTTEAQNNRRREYSNAAVNRLNRNIELEWNLWDVERLLDNTESADQLPEAAARYFTAKKHTLDGSYSFVLERSYTESVYADDTVMRTEGYGKDLTVVLHEVNGKPVRCPHYNRTELIPDYDGSAPENHFYQLMPLHHQRCVFGYFVITDSLALFRDGFIYYVSNRLNQYLERFRKDKKLEILNRQLAELYTHDPLTGLYNRFGHEKTSVPLVEKNRAEGKNSIVIFADINRMKYINDQFGHLQGDLALRAVADSLRHAAPEDWIISRFGGDEFILVGSCTGRDEAEERIQMLRDQISAKEKRMSLPYRLRASFGYFLVTPESHDPLSRYLSLADEAMYLDKKEFHEKDGLDERPSWK